MTPDPTPTSDCRKGVLAMARKSAPWLDLSDAPDVILVLTSGHGGDLHTRATGVPRSMSATGTKRTVAPAELKSSFDPYRNYAHGSHRGAA
jgi:hypothetical protein